MPEKFNSHGYLEGGSGETSEKPVVVRKRSEKADARVRDRNEEIKRVRDRDAAIKLDNAYKKLASTSVPIDVARETQKDNDVFGRKYFNKDNDKIVEVRSGFVSDGQVSRDKISVKNIDQEAFLRDFKEAETKKSLKENLDVILTTGSIPADVEKASRIDLTPDELSSINAENEIEISSTEELENKCAKIVNELKDKYGININIDGTIPSGFLGRNRKKVLKLEETDSYFASETEKLVVLNKEIDSIKNPKANLRIESNIDKKQVSKSAGNVLTGN